MDSSWETEMGTGGSRKNLEDHLRGKGDRVKMGRNIHVKQPPFLQEIMLFMICKRRSDQLLIANAIAAANGTRNSFLT